MTYAMPKLPSIISMSFSKYTVALSVMKPEGGSISPVSEKVMEGVASSVLRSQT